MSRRQHPGYNHPGGRPPPPPPPPPPPRPKLPDLRDCDIIDMDDGHVLEDFPPAAAGGAGGREPARGGHGGADGRAPAGGQEGRGGVAAPGGRPAARGGRGGGGQGEDPGPWHRAFRAIFGFTYPCRGQGCRINGECDRGFVREFLLHNARCFGYRGPRNARGVVQFLRPYAGELLEELEAYFASVDIELILRRGGVAVTRDMRNGRLMGDNRRGRGGVGGGAGGGGGNPGGIGPRRGMEMRRGYGY